MNATAKVTFLMLTAVVAWGCAATGSLSSDLYTADDLAELQYESMYEFLDSHSKVRVAQSAGEVPLAVRARGSGGMTSPSIGSDTAGGGGPGSLGGGGGEGGEEAPDRRNAGMSNYTTALLYVNGSEVADPRTRLREMPLDEVESVRVLRPSEASARFGGSGNRAAVAIELKR